MSGIGDSTFPISHTWQWWHLTLVVLLWKRTDGWTNATGRRTDICCFSVCLEMVFPVAIINSRMSDEACQWECKSLGANKSYRLHVSCWLNQLTLTEDSTLRLSNSDPNPSRTLPTHSRALSFSRWTKFVLWLRNHWARIRTRHYRVPPRSLSVLSRWDTKYTSMCWSIDPFVRPSVCNLVSMSLFSSFSVNRMYVGSWCYVYSTFILLVDIYFASG